MAGVLQHLRSSTLNKRPNPASMVDGQIAINYASGSPGAFFKDTNGNLVKVGPVHVGATAPNVSPASGGTAGNSLGEQWLDTSGGTYVFKIWDGAAWRSEAGEFVNSTGDTMTGSLTMGPSANLIFEGSTDDGFETTLTVVDPTADRTITLPNISGTVVTTGDSGTVTSTMIADGTIVNGDVSASAAIAGTKISPDFGSQNVVTTGTSTAASFIPTSSTAPSNGIYLPGANQVAISTGGSGRLFVDASGRVGIGTTSPSELLHVAGNARIGANDTSAAQLEVGAGATGNRNSYIDLIGDTTYTDYGFRLIRLGGANNNTVLRHRGTGEFAYITEDAAPLTFYTSNSERLRITSTGLVGVGASDPTELLDLRRANGAGNLGIRLVHVGQVEYKIGINDSDDKLYITNNNGDAAIGANATGIVITPTGSVGIGTASPGRLLTLNGGGSVSYLQITNTTAGASSSNGLEIYCDGTNAGLINRENGALTFDTNNTERARIDSSGRLLVGTSSTSANARVLLQGSSGNNNANLWLARSNSPGTGPSDKQLGAVLFCADNHVFSALIEAQRDGGTWTAGSSQPTLLAFSTAADGASSPTERMRIANTGNAYIVSTSNALAITTTLGANGSNYFLRGLYSGTAGVAESGTTSFYVYTNGNVQNTNNSYGAISDIKLKENIVDASSQWSDIKALQVRKYNFKEGQTHTQIGLVAQEVELVSPGLVTESPDRDAEGNDLGTVTKSVNYSVLYMKAVKALQEAMERIEQLEQRLADAGIA